MGAPRDKTSKDTRDEYTSNNQGRVQKLLLRFGAAFARGGGFPGAGSQPKRGTVYQWCRCPGPRRCHRPGSRSSRFAIAISSNVVGVGTNANHNALRAACYPCKLPIESTCRAARLVESSQQNCRYECKERAQNHGERYEWSERAELEIHAHIRAFGRHAFHDWSRIAIRRSQHPEGFEHTETLITAVSIPSQDKSQTADVARHAQRWIVGVDIRLTI
jgi:hypothetical protein